MTELRLTEGCWVKLSNGWTVGPLREDVGVWLTDNPASEHSMPLTWGLRTGMTYGDRRLDIVKVITPRTRARRAYLEGQRP